MRPRRSRSVLVCCALWLALGPACGPADPDPLEVGTTTARAALEQGDPSTALVAVRRALATGGEGPALRLAAAEACLALKRWSEVIEHATAGLQLSPSADLAADLRWAEGKAALGRFRDLGSEDDWRRANSSFEFATAAGSRRAESALALVLLQEASPQLGSTERMRRFVDLLARVAPGSRESEVAAQRLALRLAGEGSARTQAGEADTDDGGSR